jgi:hypothetical protein
MVAVSSILLVSLKVTVPIVAAVFPTDTIVIVGAINSGPPAVIIPNLFNIGIA